MRGKRAVSGVGGLVLGVLCLVACDKGTQNTVVEGAKKVGTAIGSSAAETENLARVGEARTQIAAIYKGIKDYALENGKLPPGAPRTPALVPTKSPATDPDGTWDNPTWKALKFAQREPHSYSYELEVKGDTFTIRAFGDLDGDGVNSTFEQTGTVDSGGSASAEPVRAINETE